MDMAARSLSCVLRHILYAGTAIILFGATPAPVDGLIQHPAHFFDLDHKVVTFRSGQPVQVRGSRRLRPRGKPAKFGRVTLPFEFPFAGRRWTEAYVNLTGNITFGAPDGEFPYRVTWPDGTMRSRAAMAELDAARGERHMIAPLWGVHDQENARVWLRASAREVVVTWDVAAYLAPFEGYVPLGRNVFQASLQAGGEVEFRYGGIAEKDGVVGLFPGLAPRETELEDGVFDAGSMLHFAAPARDAQTRIYVLAGSSGILMQYGNDGPYAFGIIVEGSNVTPTDPMLPTLSRREGDLVHFYLPKLALTSPDRFRWKTEEHTALREVRLNQPWRFGADLSTGRARVTGNTYEVFHYPHMWKSRHATFKSIHRRRPGKAELAIAFTDFRIDDVHNHGASNAAVTEGGSSRWLGSDYLLSAAGPVYLGPRFAETIVTPGRTYKNHAFGVGWMAHEMIHLWGVRARFTPPIAGPDLHWLPLLETKVVAPVASLFADRVYREGSIMGGMELFKGEDGRFHGKNSEGAASGLSALDLWLMGLIRADEVPAGHEEMRLVVDNEFLPVRFRDVAAANPPAAKAPRGFRQAVYVLHENERSARPEALALASSLERSLLRYYEAASQGRMTVRLAE
jgi:hypothetical protein